MLNAISLLIILLCSGTKLEDFVAPPGVYWTSWVGNSFGGDGGPNGFGFWVQNGVDEIEVALDGTVFAGVEWDEAGRCVGLYKDGQVNQVLLKTEGDELQNSAWGWGTGTEAIAINGQDIYIANTGKKLLHFQWTPGELNSWRFIRATDMRDKAVGMSAGNNLIAIVYKGFLELRDAEKLSVTGGFDIDNAKDVTIAPDGSLWVLTNNVVKHLSQNGKDLGETIVELQRPTSVSLSHDGRLIICDDGPRQQVLFFNISAEPRLESTFGEFGGLLSGIKGMAEPKKLFALRGAGTDAKNNLYVAMSFGSGPNGNFFLRSFDQSGNFRWELISTAFVDTFGFDHESDGQIVYGRTVVFELDLQKIEPGKEWSLKAITVDHINHQDDPRLKYGCTAILRNLEGRRVLYCIGQYAGGYRIYTFDSPETYIAKEIDHITGDDQWAWDVDDNGNIWHGDAPGKKIKLYRFKGWTSDNRPAYDWQNPDVWDWPEGWALIRRINYDQATDSLYLTGYLEGQRIETWGVVGSTARRYDGWLKGEKRLVWTNLDLPRDDNPEPNEGPLTPKAMDIAGDYMFLGMVKPTKGKQLVHILRLSDGEYVGTFEPGPATGEGHGWLDMPYAVQAIKRKNGEYLILVEEDWRGKNLLYRWRPNSTD